LAIVVEATQRADYFNPLICSRTKEGRGGLLAAWLPGVQECRELANALAARALLRVEEGQLEEAWQDLLACHRLGRLVARGPLIIESYVGMAIDQIASKADLAYLERAHLTCRQIKDRLQDLQHLPSFPPPADKIDLGERFVYLDSLQLVRRFGFSMLEDRRKGVGQGKKGDSRELKVMERIDWEPALRNGNRWYDRVAAALRCQDRIAREKDLDTIDQDLNALKKEVVGPTLIARLLLGKDPAEKAIGKAIGGTLLPLLLPACHSVQRSHERSVQVDRNLHIAFALAAYHRDHRRYPAKLDDLAPRYLAVVPDDLFSGKSLIYRPSERGYMLYSVGVNKKDDGGRWYDDNPAGDDLGVRMPLPKQKR
jgi:hypothetical protein